MLAVAFCVFVVYPLVSLFIPRQGTVNSVSDLEKIYSQADRVTKVSFTNSITQKLPFYGPIHYRLILFKEPLIILNGQVNTNLLYAFINANTNTVFYWSGADNEFETGWPNPNLYPTTVWTNIVFKSEIPVDVVGVGTYVAGVEGEISLLSGTIKIRASSSDGPVSPNK